MPESTWPLNGFTLNCNNTKDKKSFSSNVKCIWKFLKWREWIHLTEAFVLFFSKRDFGIWYLVFDILKAFYKFCSPVLNNYSFGIPGGEFFHLNKKIQVKCMSQIELRYWILPIWYLMDFTGASQIFSKWGIWDLNVQLLHSLTKEPTIPCKLRVCGYPNFRVPGPKVRSFFFASVFGYNQKTSTICRYCFEPEISLALRFYN